MEVKELDRCLCWFGDNWGAGICREAPRVPVPVGAICSCGERIDETDDGLMLPHVESVLMIGPDLARGRNSMVTHRPWHLECALALLVGPQAVTVTEVDTDA